MNRRLRTASTWIALVAMLLAALLPTLARAGGAEEGRWLDVCSTTAPKPGGDPAAAVLDHCPACTLQGSGWAPPPAPPALQTPAAAALPVHGPLQAVPPALRSRSTAAPRGPPATA